MPQPFYTYKNSGEAFFSFSFFSDMPTTRSTVEEQPQESIQTIRERRYASRKKRNNVNAQSPKQKIMMQFLNAMIEYE